MKLHFIAIGGAAMHNLAIALKNKGHNISGSDDEIFDPAKSRLIKHGLLPEKFGWHSENITPDLDGVILGMHARKDNPELKKALRLGIKIYSFPEYLYEQSKNKKRVVIGGSHGKTTITAMILHVLDYHKINCDYLVGAKLKGFDVMVRLSDAPIMIFEGDEYLTSPIDPRPKFHWYKPHIALLSGIAWDHINVFPTYENYITQFRIFIGLIEKDGCLIYCSDDPELKKLVENTKTTAKKKPYSLPDFSTENGITCINTKNGKTTLHVFGRHNLLNIEGAKLVCNELGIDDECFYEAISSFAGASNRLELLSKNHETAVYKDFAHAPSKLKATVEAVSEQFPDRKLLACMELHTFSSLSKNFLKHYRGTMDKAEIPVVFFNPHKIELKKLPPVTPGDIIQAFNNKRLIVFNNSDKLKNFLLNQQWKNKNLLMMSSGNFGGLDIESMAQQITSI